MAESVKLFARKCDECGKGTNDGFYAGGVVYCSEPCLHKHITPVEWDELYDDGDSDDYYWTEWEELDADGPIYNADGYEVDREGNVVVAPCPYCGGCGEGTYWTHDLKDTVDTQCHVCNGNRTMPVDMEWAYALDAAGDDRRDEYCEEHPWADARYDALWRARIKKG